MSPSHTVAELANREARRLDFDLDGWLVEVVSEDHPDWKQADGSCPECWAEVQRMNERAETVQVI